MTSKTTNKFSSEVREARTRLILVLMSPPDGVGNTDGIPFVEIEMRGRFLWLVVPHQQGCSPISETMMGFGFPGQVRIPSLEVRVFLSSEVSPHS